MRKIAVIGTGIMGSGIVRNFLKNGYEVFVWNRNKDKLKELVNMGAKEAMTPAEATELADIIIEVTANDESSKSVWESSDGILSKASPEKYLITCATLSVKRVDTLAKMCKQKKLTFFDMPMTGGRSGAENGKLILLAGGNPEKLNDIEEDLRSISEKVKYFGEAGSGMRYKLLLNMLQAIHITGLGEVLRIAGKTGLDVRLVGDALSERPGGTTTNLAWRDYQKEPVPINFSVDWITKDLNYAKELAETINTPLLDQTLKKFKKAIENKMGKKDWTAVNKLD